MTDSSYGSTGPGRRIPQVAQVLSRCANVGSYASVLSPRGDTSPVTARSEQRKRVLLTGGSGFIGANLTRRLIAEGHEVHLLVRPKEARWRLAGLAGQLALHEGAVEERDLVDKIVAEVQPQWVFHLAAYGCYSTQRDVQAIVRTNYNGTVNLVEACLQTEFEVLVNAGTSSEYGNKDHAPPESELAEPNSHYAATKAAATLYCRFIANKAQRRIPTLRLYSVFGPWEEPARLVPTLLTCAMHGEYPPLVARGTPRDYVYVDDVVEALLLAAERPTDDPGAVLNIGTGTQTTLHELVDIVREQFHIGCAPRWGSMPQRDWDTDTWVADPRAAKETIGWKPGYDLEAGLRAFAKWMLAEPATQSFYETHDKAPS